MAKPLTIPDALVISKIYHIRNQKVMLDIDLAELYKVETKRLNEQVKRNSNRFPVDFLFQLTVKEWESLRSQFATSNVGRGGRRYAHLAFTFRPPRLKISKLFSIFAVSTETIGSLQCL